MFAGGGYEEVERWLLLFVNSHAKRENPRVEAIIEGGDERAGTSFGVRLRLGDRYHPGLGQPSMEFPYEEVSAGKGDLSWCDTLSRRVRAWAGELAEAEGTRGQQGRAMG